MKKLTDMMMKPVEIPAPMVVVIGLWMLNDNFSRALSGFLQ